MFKFTDYHTSEGALALSSEIHVADMPRSTETPYPTHLRQEAQRYADQLSEVFEALGEELRIQRDLVQGQRIDPRKRHAIGVAMRKGEVNVGELRPYQRREVTLTGLPRISIVASVGVAECNADWYLLDKLTQLSLAVGWACENIGIDVDAVLMEGHAPDYLSPNQPYRAAQLAYVLLEPGRFTPLQSYSVTRSTMLMYEVGFAGTFDTDKAAQRKMADLQGMKRIGWGRAYPGRDGGHGVYWARQHRQSDLVIGVGNLTDIQDADIRLHNGFKVADAITEIARQARTLIMA